MQAESPAKMLRIYIGERDKTGHTTAYEALLLEARRQGISGVTVLRAIMGYGASASIHTAKLIEITDDLPIVIEIVDSENKVAAFLPWLDHFFNETGIGATVTIEEVKLLNYKARAKK